ncbi:MAG: 1-acyl-sn-glycerol-3-phosphate acyltransferase [Chloroflexi bacterium]|nr:1-acyl-sn-glycerol-3-phosphate acyltransferase [Chloroflexota bacterium]
MPLVSCLLHVVTRAEFHGLERVPRNGPLLIVCNHLGHLDPPLVAAGLPVRPELIAASEVMEVPVVGWALRQYGAIPVKRGDVDREVIGRALTILESGGILGLAPEGRESPTGALIEGKVGPAYLAMKTCSPILPMAITGTKNAWQAIRRGRRPRVTLTVGEAFRLPPLPPPGPARKAALRDATETIMRRIAALLPEEYRGVYG